MRGFPWRRKAGVVSVSEAQINVKEVLDLKPKALLIDLDGTLMIGRKAVPGAIRLVNEFAGRCAIITNNSSEMPGQLSRQLSRIGIQIIPDLIFTAGVFLVEELSRRQRRATVLPILSPSILKYARSQGILITEDAADIVAVGRDSNFDYRKLSKAVSSVKCGAQVIAANNDLNHPGLNGELIPETGSIIAAIQAAAGNKCDVEILGKPMPEFAMAALHRLGMADTNDIVVVGDNENTDGALARAIDAKFYQVRIRTHDSD